MPFQQYLSLSSSFYDKYHIRELLTENPPFWRGCQATAHGYVRGQDPALLHYARAHAHMHIHCAMDRVTHSLCLPLQQECSGHPVTAHEGSGENISGFYLQEALAGLPRMQIYFVHCCKCSIG